MSSRFLRQIMLLLFLGQLLLGAIGWALVRLSPWAGLPATLLLLWLVWRLAVIFRDEVSKALRSGAAIAPGRLAFFVALGVQLPGLALLPFWAPRWITAVWQGAVLPAAALLGRLWPAHAETFAVYLWLAAALEIGLFVATALPRTPRRIVVATPKVARAAGEWAPARRVADVEKKGLKIR